MQGRSLRAVVICDSARICFIRLLQVAPHELHAIYGCSQRQQPAGASQGNSYRHACNQCNSTVSSD